MFFQTLAQFLNDFGVLSFGQRDLEEEDHGGDDQQHDGDVEHEGVELEDASGRDITGLGVTRHADGDGDQAHDPVGGGPG